MALEIKYIAGVRSTAAQIQGCVRCDAAPGRKGGAGYRLRGVG